jgi:catechol 2,3-dioxygenase-like lactoylglutathione lyase family enzyme
MNARPARRHGWFYSNASVSLTHLRLTAGRRQDSRRDGSVTNEPFQLERKNIMSLGNEKIMAFAATTDTDAAKDFYENKLGLKLVEDSQFALVFDSNGIMLRVQKLRELNPPQFTVLGWQVADIRAEIKELTGRGIVFTQYGMDFPKQDELGIWTTPDGTLVAWFKDPDGHTLSLTQF